MFMRRFFSTAHMVPQSSICGELPSYRQAYRNALAIAWPSALEAFLVALIAAVDTIMVGSLGAEAISAVGITTQPKFVVLTVIISLNVGVTTIVARRKGENDPVSANRCLRQGIILSTLLAFTLGVFAFVFAPQLLIFSGAGADILADSVVYFRIIMIGNFFYSVGLTINAAQRGVGNTKISMTTNLTANVINLVFNYLLIGGRLGFPRWGVMGAAIATALGNFVAFVMSFYSVLHPHGGFLRLSRKDGWHFDFPIMRQIFRISSGAMAEQLFTRFGLFSYARIVAGLGTIPFAAHQIVMNALSISFSFGDGLGVASSALVGQSLGAHRPDHAILYGKISQRIGLIISVVLCAAFITLRYPIVSVFNDTAEILRMSSPLMVITGFACLFQVSSTIYSGSLRGSGDIIYVAAMSLISIGIVRPIISWALCYPLGLGLTGAWIGLLIEQFLRLILYCQRFLKYKWVCIVV